MLVFLKFVVVVDVMLVFLVFVVVDAAMFVAIFRTHANNLFLLNPLKEG